MADYTKFRQIPKIELWDAKKNTLSQQEIRVDVMGDEFASDSAVRNVVKRARQEMQNRRDCHYRIKNIRGDGYQLVCREVYQSVSKPPKTPRKTKEKICYGLIHFTCYNAARTNNSKSNNRTSPRYSPRFCCCLCKTLQATRAGIFYTSNFQTATNITYLACQMLNREPDYVQFAGKDPLAFVVSQNLCRRHLSESQRAMVAAAIIEL